MIGRNNIYDVKRLLSFSLQFIAKSYAGIFLRSLMSLELDQIFWSPNKYFKRHLLLFPNEYISLITFKYITFVFHYPFIVNHLQMPSIDEYCKNNKTRILTTVIQKHFCVAAVRPSGWTKIKCLFILFFHTF
jgi:hypothetical protein